MENSIAHYVYGLARDRDAKVITDALSRVAPPPHFGPFSLFPHDSVTLIASPLSAAAFDGDREIRPARRTMLSHARVLEAIVTCAPVLPMQFGVVCPNIAEIKSVSMKSEDALAELDRLEGRAEWGVRVAADRDAMIAVLASERPELRQAYRQAADRGAAGHYDRVELGRRVGRLLSERRAQAETALLRRLAPLADAHKRKPHETDGEILRAEFLLPLNREEAFAEAVAAAGAELATCDGVAPNIRIVGPAPASHFVNLRIDLAASASRHGTA